MKTLIVFGSKYGTTEKCAKMIRENLDGKADLVNLKKQTTVEVNSYDTILIGGSIYVGKLQQEVKKFVDGYHKTLENKNVGLFLCCQEKGEKAMAFMNNNLPHWIVEKAFVKEILGHEIYLEKMNFFERFLMKAVFKIKKNYSKLDLTAIQRIGEKVKAKDAVNE